MNIKLLAFPLVLVCAGLLNTPVWAQDIRQETSVLAELKLDSTTGQASAVLRGASTSAVCSDGTGLMNLSVASPAAQLLYSLLVSAHLGERKVTLWFDLYADCEITQAQLVD